MCLDGQPLAIAIEAHLARPAIPAATELLRGLCAAAGLCLERAGCALRKQVKALREQAAAVQAAMERSQSFWRTMLGRLPEGCRRPLSSSCRWRRRAHCRHQGRRLCLGEPPWQPKTANAAAAAPGRVAASRGAALSSARMPERTSRSASGSAAAASGALHSSSTSPRERASREAARLGVPVLARAAFQTRTPTGGRGPRRRCRARTSTTVPARLYLPRLEPGCLQFSSSATTYGLCN